MLPGDGKPGADCILLIAACLADDAQFSVSRNRRPWPRAWTCSSKCNDGDELDRALKTEDPLVGINNRNLRTLSDARHHAGLLQRDAGGPIAGHRVSASSARRCACMRAAKVNAFLVGARFFFMRSDPRPGWLFAFDHARPQRLRGQLIGPAVDAWAASPAGQKPLAFVARRHAGATIPTELPLTLDAAGADLRRHPRPGPYHGPARPRVRFSVPEGVPLSPPSLRNIFSEIQ